MKKKNQSKKLSAKRSRKIISPKNTMKRDAAPEKRYAESMMWYKRKSDAMGKRPRLHQ